MQLHYSYWGSEKSEVSATTQPVAKTRLVFLHGMGGTGSLWRPIAASMEQEFEILAPDQRGHGKSFVPHIPGSRESARYTPLDYGKDIVQLQEKLGFHPAFLIGHSMGVRTACAAAHLRPEWTRGLVLIDLGFSGPAGGGLGQGLADFLKILPMQFPSRDSARQFMAEKCPDPSIAQYLMAVSLVKEDRTLTFPFDKAALLETLEAARSASVRTWARDLASRGIPIWVLRGGNSLVWSREQFEEEKAAFADLPSIRFETIEGAGHGLPFEKRLEFVEQLKNFILSCPDERTS